MAEYTKEQLKALRDRWKEHEKELKALIPVIKADGIWHESEEYRALMDALEELPEGVEEALNDLRGADLREAHLEGANLVGAYLEGANLWGAELQGADLVGAHLREADLREAKLQGADLWGAYLSNTKNWLNVEWNSKHGLWPKVKRFDLKGKKLEPCERQTVFGANDIRNANWAGAQLLERYVKDENFLVQYKKRGALHRI